MKLYRSNYKIYILLLTIFVCFAFLIAFFKPYNAKAQSNNSTDLSKLMLRLFIRDYTEKIFLAQQNAPEPTIIVREKVDNGIKDIFRVNADSMSSAPTGENWDDAFSTINDALAVAGNGDEIWVAEGVYNENLVLEEDVSIYGGFTGVENQRLKPGPGDFSSILDGGGIGPVITVSSNSRIEGFVIRNGNAEFGGGIYSDGAVNVEIIGNLITNNSATDSGGGIASIGGTAVIRNNKIMNNTAEFNGGGVFLQYTGGSNSLLSHNLIRGNEAENGGGVYYWEGVNIPIRNNMIISNEAKQGAGIWLGMYSTPNVMHNVIAFNTAYESSGGLYCEFTTETVFSNIINNTFYKNSVNGGSYYGMFFNKAMANLENLIVSNTEQAVVSDLTLLIDMYSNLNDHNPLLIGPTFEDDPEIFDYHLSDESPDRDAGNPSPSYNDRDGSRNDLGAYGGPEAGMAGPDYESPEIETNDLVFEQEDPNGTEIIYTRPDLLPDGLLKLYAQAAGEGIPDIIATALDNDLMPPFLIEPEVDANGRASQIFDYGTTEVIITVQDGYGWETSGTANVTIEDTTAPVPDVDPLPESTLECPGTITEIPTAWDAGVGTVLADTNSPLTFEDPNTYIITWIYDDGRGNVSTQEQTIIIEDTTAPVPDEADLADVTGECSAEVTTIPTATNGCAGTVEGTTTDPLLYEDQGTFTITWTFDDGNGNISTQEQTVIVNDEIAPVPDGADLTDVTGECSAEVTATPTATDNCEGTITGTTTDPLSYDEVGTYTITWTYDDGNGNTSTQTQTVIVEDTTDPTVNAGSAKTVSKGTEVTLEATVSDNCSGELAYEWKEGADVLGDSDTLTHTFGVGTHTVTLTVTDEGGNSASDTVKVTVKSTTTARTTGYYPYYYTYPYIPWSSAGRISPYYYPTTYSNLSNYSYSLFGRGTSFTPPYSTYSLSQFNTPYRYTYPMLQFNGGFSSIFRFY